MEFTNPEVNGKDSPRTTPISSYVTDKIHGADHPLGYDLREPRSMNGALDREIFEKARKMSEEMIAYEMAKREMMMQMECSDPRKVLPSYYHQAMDFLVSPWSHLRSKAEVTASEGKMAPSQTRGTEGGNISGTKRKAESPPPRAAEAIDVPSVNYYNMKKTEEDGLYCKVCKLSSTSKQALMDHLRGKKHKSKVGSTSKSENLRFPFWCDVCKVGANTENVMSCHERGKKHVKLFGRTTDEANGVDANVVDTAESEKDEQMDKANIGKDGIIEDIKNENED